MPRDGSFTLSDVRELTLAIVCEPCGRRGRLSVARLMVEHGDAKLTDLLAHARLLPEGALGQRSRPVRGDLRAAAAVRGLSALTRAAPTFGRLTWGADKSV
jgi:hypothetical protein